MAVTLQFRKGLDANVAGASASDGEPLWATDTHQLWVSQGGVKYQVGGGGGGGPPAAHHATHETGGSDALAALDASVLTSGSLPAGRFPALTGDVTTTAGALAATLAASGVTAGTYGDGSNVPQVTLDAKGRVTAASQVPITGTLPDPVTAAHGGTGATSLAAHGVLVGAGTGAVSVTAPGTAGQVLVSGGAGADPSFTTVLDLGSVGGGNTLTTYSGTTANAYATVFTLTRGDGLLGTLTVKNTGANAVTFKRSVTDAFGTAAADTPGMTGGQTATWDLDSLAVPDTFGGSGLTAMAPMTALTLEAKSAIPGSPTTYSIALAVTAAGGAVSLGRSRLTADATNATTTLSDLSDLSVTAAAGRKYTGRLTLKCSNSTATGGVKLDFGGGTATAASFWAVASPAGTSGSGGAIVTGTLVGTTLTSAINYTTITGETLLVVDFSLVVSAGGTLVPRVATNSAGTVTAQLGSSLQLLDSPN